MGSWGVSCEHFLGLFYCLISRNQENWADHGIVQVSLFLLLYDKFINSKLSLLMLIQ